MNIKDRVNITVLTNDLNIYKTNWLNHHNLTEKINKGELLTINIEQQKEQKTFTVFTKDYYTAIKNWYNNFIKLWFNRYPQIEINKKEINYLKNKYQTSTQLINEIRNIINIDNDLLDWLAYYIRNIYLQPVFYYDAIKLYPDTLPEVERTIKRYDYISNKCNVVQDKFKSLTFRDVKDIINKLIVENKETEKLLKKIFFFTETFIYSLPNDRFVYSQSPVFISFIDTIRELKQYYDFNINNNGLPQLNNCINNNNDKKVKFELPVFENKTATTSTNIENQYPQIFSDKEYNLFLYLNDEYSRDNKSPKAKYSYIYHFLKYENSISGTQQNYIDFIKKEYNTKMSKIQPINYKYDDEIKPLLMRLKGNFNKQNNN